MSASKTQELSFLYCAFYGHEVPWRLHLSNLNSLFPHCFALCFPVNKYLQSDCGSIDSTWHLLIKFNSVNRVAKDLSKTSNTAFLFRLQTWYALVFWLTGFVQAIFLSLFGLSVFSSYPSGMGFYSWHKFSDSIALSLFLFWRFIVHEVLQIF